jgi:hypothetical protein
VQLSCQSRAHQTAARADDCNIMHFDGRIAWLFIVALAFPPKILYGWAAAAVYVQKCGIAKYKAQDLHNAFANVHDGGSLNAEHVVLRLQQLPHRLGQREKARMALHHKVSTKAAAKPLCSALQLCMLCAIAARVYLPVISGKASVHIDEFVGEGGIDGGCT